MSHHYLKRIVEWINENSLEDVLNETQQAMDGIECSECLSDQGVRHIDWGRGGSEFWCTDCIKRIKEFGIPEIAPPGLLKKRFLVFSRDNFKCIYCGRNPREHDTTLEIEHVHPKSKGGTDSLDNLVTACRECNAGKGDVLLNERNLSIIKYNRW